MTLHLVDPPTTESLVQEDFFSQYLAYVSNTEVPTFFHRWSCIAGVGAMLGRNYYFQHGHFTVNPNIYCMLIGSPGTRKSTAIKLMKGLLIQAGYSTIAADKTTKEKFMLDLAGETGDAENLKGLTADQLLDRNIFGEPDETNTIPAEMLIAADEFNDFFGNGNIEFISLLGTLWDYSGIYKNRIKNGKSVSICNPTINILGGNTPTGFSLAFPTDILGQGFFSRLLLIYGEPTGKRITFPKAPDPVLTAELVSVLSYIRNKVVGMAKLSPAAERLLDKIYQSWRGIDDVRFASYSNRRFTHLLKLCLIHSAAALRNEIHEADVVYANTVLTHTEHLMPKALGEFGKAKHSDVSHKLIQVLEEQNRPVSLKELWKHVSNDLDKINDLSDLLRNLVAADKIQTIKEGFLPKRRIRVEKDDGTTDFSLLTAEERTIL